MGKFIVNIGHRRSFLLPTGRAYRDHLSSSNYFFHRAWAIFTSWEELVPGGYVGRFRVRKRFNDCRFVYFSSQSETVCLEAFDRIGPEPARSTVERRVDR